MALNVVGKTAIVTGAGSGINSSFAQLLLEQGCNVVIADLSLRPEAKTLLQSYSYPGNGGPKQARAVFQQTDVTDWMQLDAAFLAAEKAFGRIDIVCPGAGVYDPPFSNFWIPPGTSPSKDDARLGRYASIDINLTHAIRCTQMAIAHFMRHRHQGVVLLISSIAAQRAHLACPIYVAAKHGISGFTRSLKELETPPDANLPKIRVVTVAPGVIKTPLWTDNPEKLKFIIEGQDEWVTPDEVANVMLDLVQKEEYIGGTVLEVGKNQTRRVEALNDPGPSGAGHTTSNVAPAKAEVWERLSQMQ